MTPNLGPKLGPFPLAVWAVIVAGGLYVGYRRRQNAPDAPADPATDEGATDAGTAGADTSFPADTSTGVPDAGGDVAEIQTGSANTPTIHNDRQWRIAAVNALIAHGVSPIHAETAIYKWLHSKVLSAAEAKIVNLAESLVGPPPTIPGPPSSVKPKRHKKRKPAPPTTHRLTAAKASARETVATAAAVHHPTAARLPSRPAAHRAPKPRVTR